MWQRSNSAAQSFLRSARAGGSGVLPAEATAGDDASAAFAAMEAPLDRSLWFDLGEAVLAYASLPRFDPVVASLSQQQQQQPQPQPPRLEALYGGFVAQFEAHLNPLVYARVAARIAGTMDGDEAIAFLAARAQFVARGDHADSDAHLFLLAESALRQLALDRVDAARANMDAIEGALARRPVADPIVRAGFFHCQAQLLKRLGRQADFYRATLTYLSYVQLDSLRPAVREATAAEILVAALVGDDTYNFGDLIQHPIAAYASQAPAVAWLEELVRAVCFGNLSEYRACCERYAANIAAVPALVQHRAALDQKVAVLALIELAFAARGRRAALRYDEIAAATGTAPEAVELLVMRALSLGLLRGEMDGPASLLHVEWVKPRVLNMTHVVRMRDQLAAWTRRVHSTLVAVEAQAPDHAVSAQQ
jgi:26S proteasome regulatory subunit N9